MGHAGAALTAELAKITQPALGGERAPQHQGAHHQLLHPGPAHPRRPADHLPRLRARLAVPVPSLFAAHVARFLDTDAKFP
jgi:hypothetical protein